MVKSQVDEIIETDYENLPMARDLYREFIKKSNIEKVKEERFVLKELMSGKKSQEILSELKKKHPDTEFTNEDFERFMERNREVMKFLQKDISTASRRFQNARAEIEETMRDLYLFNREVVRDLAEKEDATNLVAAIRALNMTVMNYAKLAGILDLNENKPNVNIVNVISDKYEGLRLKDRVHSRADFKEEPIIVEIKESVQNETDGESGESNE